MSPTTGPPEHGPGWYADARAVLGVTPAASPAEIHHAFRRRLRELHPDTRRTADPPSERERQASDRELQRILAAYEALREAGAAAAPDHASHGSTPRGAAAASPPVARHPRRPDLVVGPVQWTPAPAPHEPPSAQPPATGRVVRPGERSTPTLAELLLLHWRLEDLRRRR